jgi:hypothetical protein
MGMPVEDRGYCSIETLDDLIYKVRSPTVSKIVGLTKVLGLVMESIRRA